MVSSSPPKIGGLSLSEPDTEVELERFRREWQEEVKGKARKVPPAEITIPPKSKSKDKAESDGVAIAQVQVDEPDLALQLSRTRSGASAATSSKPVPISPKKVLRSPVKSTSRLPEPPLSTSPTKIPFRAPQLRKDRDAAVVIYSRAVEAEQSGRLNDALGLYRTAFKMDDNVDKLYQRLVIKRAETQPEVEEASVVDVVDPTAPDDAPFAFRTHIQVQPDYERAGVVRRTKESRLTTLLSGQEGAEFLPAEEELPVPIASLPAELVEPILAHLDVASIEAFGSTCWRARSLTANAGVWRRIVQYLYRPPMIPRAITAVELSRRHAGEWRTTLIEEERVRMDGCYISVCHYVRPGAGEEWVAVTHMITYHRFLRFYPDGSVISFLTTDHPLEVVPHLNRNLRGKGLHHGRWRLVRSDDLGDDEATETEAEPQARLKKDEGPKRPRARVLVSDLIEPDSAVPKYEFEMDIALRETNRGRWNKLNLSRYSTINLRTEEVLDLSLRHQKPFYFSKVRSWAPPL